MVAVGLCIADSFATIDTIVKIGQIYAIILDKTQIPNTEDQLITEDGPVLGESKTPVLVQHYAKRELCMNFEGQKYFYKAMKTKFCSLTLTFTANHVIDLCRKRDFMLVNWVSELFDFDKDGYISHMERNYYLNYENKCMIDKDQNSNCTVDGIIL